MRIRVDQPEGALVDAIYLDGKRLIMCIEADDEEGWVKISLPPKQIPTDLMPNLAKDEKALYVGDPIGPDDWEEKTLFGVVDIVMREVEGLEDEGLDA